MCFILIYCSLIIYIFMKTSPKQPFPLRRFNSMTEEYQHLNNRFPGGLLASHPGSKLEDLDQTQPMSDPTIGKFSTFIGFSGTSLNEINQFEEDSIAMNTGSEKGGSNIAKQKNPKLAESFDDFSENESQQSEVLFIGSRDLTEKKLHEIHVSKSFQFDDLLKKHKKQQSPKTNKKAYVKVEEYQSLEEKTKKLETRNKELEDQNQELRHKIAALEEAHVKTPCKMQPPEFIRNRQTKKNMKSAMNLTFAHSSFGRAHKQNGESTTYLHDKLISDRKNSDHTINPVRATFSTGADLQKTLQKIREQHHKQKQLNKKATKHQQI